MCQNKRGPAAMTMMLLEGMFNILQSVITVVEKIILKIYLKKGSFYVLKCRPENMLLLFLFATYHLWYIQ